MNAEQPSNNRAICSQATPPFEFDIYGNISFCSAAATMEEIHEFARHYVNEWLLWHSSEHLDARMSDMAALIVSAVNCRFLPDYSLEYKIEWIKRLFHWEDFRVVIPMRMTDFSASALDALRALRPSISQGTERLNPLECDPLLQFALPVESMLVLGGDHRLLVNQVTQLNGYGCRPFPRPEAITFSSSTATSISKFAFDNVEHRRRKFISEATTTDIKTAVASLAQEVRDAISLQLEIGAKLAEVVITASGTDSFLIAHGLTRFLSEMPPVSLIVGVEESGSGVKLALQERHFADDTALTYAVHKGQRISTESHQERQIDIPVRDEAGNEIPVSVLDIQVHDLVIKLVAAGNFVVVHAMNHSKLGYSGPSRSSLVKLKQDFGAQVCIVVDACQMRLDREEITQYLEHEMILIVTGSKFFTGPPFCGAILLPKNIADKIQTNGEKFDPGFNSYCASEDLPVRLRPILDSGAKPFNLGVLFRWVAAISEMERYYGIPSEIRGNTVAQFCDRAEKILLAVPYIELHYHHAYGQSQWDIAPRELSGRRMIFPFFLYFDHAGIRELCTEAQVQKIYSLLNQDCSTLFSYKNAREFRLLAQMCHIGQPVPAIHHSGAKSAVLRISVGARIFSESFSKTTGKMVNALIEDEFWQIGVMLAKIELLLGAYANNEIEL